MDEPNEERMEESYNEGELSDDEFDFEDIYALLDRVESNIPSLTTVAISIDIARLFPNDDYHQRRLVERLSTAIGRNTQLKALLFNGRGINEAQTTILFRGIACNQNIKRLHFDGCREIGNVCSILTPLFKRNQVERMTFHAGSLSLESTRLLATSLVTFDSLKEFALTLARIQQNPEEVQVSRELMQALSGHSGLRKLYLSDNDVRKLGCSALVDLLHNPNFNLKVLDLSCNNLGDDEAAALAGGLASNTTLKEINLGRNRGITQAGWQAIFDALGSPSCRMERITLRGNAINDAAAQSLSNALARSTSSLKTMNLCNMSITPTGWRVLFWSLRSQTCALEDLELSLQSTQW